MNVNGWRPSSSRAVAKAQKQDSSPSDIAASLAARKIVFTGVSASRQLSRQPTGQTDRSILTNRRALMPDARPVERPRAFLYSPWGPYRRVMKVLSRCLKESFYGDPTKPILAYCLDRPAWSGSRSVPNQGTRQVNLHETNPMNCEIIYPNEILRRASGSPS